MSTAASVVSSLIPLISMSIVALILIVCGMGVVKNPSILSNYGSFTEEEKSSSAFHEYLKSVRAGMVAMGIMLVVAQLMAMLFGSRFFGWVSLSSALVAFLYMLYYQSKVSRRMKRKSRIYAVFSFVIWLGFLVFPLMRGTVVSYEQDTLCISGMYGVEIPRHEIRRVSLERTLPEITWRSNGFAAGSVRKGHFRTADGRSVMLFLESDKGPFLHVETVDNREIYLNSSDSEEMRILYRKIAG